MKPTLLSLAPVYHDIFKCIKPFVKFRAGNYYQIIGLDKFEDMRATVYEIRGIKGNNQRFNVKRLTIEEIYKKGIIN